MFWKVKGVEVVVVEIMDVDVMIKVLDGVSGVYFLLLFDFVCEDFFGESFLCVDVIV